MYPVKSASRLYEDTSARTAYPFAPHNCVPYKCICPFGNNRPPPWSPADGPPSGWAISGANGRIDHVQASLCKCKSILEEAGLNRQNFPHYPWFRVWWGSLCRPQIPIVWLEADNVLDILKIILNLAYLKTISMWFYEASVHNTKFYFRLFIFRKKANFYQGKSVCVIRQFHGKVCLEKSENRVWLKEI